MGSIFPEKGPPIKKTAGYPLGGRRVKNSRAATKRINKKWNRIYGQYRASLSNSRNRAVGIKNREKTENSIGKGRRSSPKTLTKKHTDTKGKAEQFWAQQTSSAVYGGILGEQLRGNGSNGCR